MAALKNVPTYAITVTFDGKPPLVDAAIVTAESATKIYCVGFHFGMTIDKETRSDSLIRWVKTDWSDDHDKIADRASIIKGRKV